MWKEGLQKSEECLKIAPLKLKPTDWETGFDRRRRNLQSQVGRPILERRTKSHTGRRAYCGSWLAGSLLSS